MSRSLERSIECCKSQARSISDFAGIELCPLQIEKYVELRNSSDTEFTTQTDQCLLETLLDDSQRVTFRTKYENIFGDTPQD